MLNQFKNYQMLRIFLKYFWIRLIQDKFIIIWELNIFSFGWPTPVSHTQTKMRIEEISVAVNNDGN